MYPGSEELRQIRQPSAQETATRNGTSEKRKQQNRAAQKTYREKRRRKLQELDELTSRSGLSANAPPDMSLATPQSSTPFPPAEADTLNTTENSDWLFDFISPAAINLPPPTPYPSSSPTALTTATITRRLSFPSLPSPSLRTLLAAKVSAAYTPTQTPRPPFNPYANNLSLSTLSFAAGFFANALACGAAEHMYCTASAQSSFYRPGITDSPYAATMLLAVQRAFDGLKPDLRPTPVQIMTSHHPAIDFFPFPSLRRRLIEGLARSPPSLSEQEFWEDVRSDGMVWWGNVEAVGGGGVPWDARSWEAKGWFLEKWVGVLGEEGDELWRASRWWREVRGEEG
ncbi:hypothetical protein DPSP01_012810 [Paraphaeosphaeria sporulosa]|uniref:BZIP domain-containing protein n=1 Tax=Paraphaeosphaeria sporulosa TaxID=1460663 RepID=A0A177CAR3_9PLEO|nr:uncharacterized protein CC84DRAFT_1260914 [Paraphaeosphaeria sporulosa]OAG03847.1 hypothetical protein CC84DRAFT_1260914 [Paraphaeosphaeria sporulosa]